MLMDDTALVATSKDMIIKKFKILKDFCDQTGMVINESKTKFMVINGSKCDKNSITIDGVNVTHTDTYVYLGSPFTEDGKISHVLNLHIESRTKQLNKFKLFCAKNSMMPFYIKKKVLEAALYSSLLYGCESWLSKNLKSVETLYVGAMKSLLGVKGSTKTDTV